MATMLSTNDTPHVGALSISGFCKLYNVGRTYLYDEIKGGRLRPSKAGTKTLIGRSEAERWFASLPPMGRLR